MTVARNGSRKLVVEDIHYRWTVAPDDEPGAAIVVELAARPSSRLVSWVEHGSSIGPGLVQRAVLDAVAAGWRPNEPGAELLGASSGHFVQRIPKS